MNPAILFGILLWCPVAFAQETTSSPIDMQSLLPPSIGQWSVSGPSRSYSGAQIFDYMDGAGEVYRAYDYRSLLVQRYARPDREEILVEMFDMGLPKNAFGVFTYMQGRGPAVPVGQDGEYRSGLLCFWQGRYFVYIQIDREDEEAKATILNLGKAVAARIHEEGERPAILSCLPDGEYLPATLRYFFRHEILNSHFFVAESNLLLLDGTSEGALVRMTQDRSYLLLIRYAEPEQADSAYTAFIAGTMPGGRDSVAVRRENGKWIACMKHRQYLAIVFDAATADNAATILENLKRRLP